MTHISISEMIQAGVHYGHKRRYWHPRMAPYIYGKKNNVDIINLDITEELFKKALDIVAIAAKRKAKILFVGSKRSASAIVREAAKRCNMPYVDYRWLGGMLTNYKTIRQSIKRLKNLEEMSTDGTFEKITKKEVVVLNRQITKLQNSLGGIKDMAGLPDMLFVIDVGHERIAVTEARCLGIPVIGVVDTNNSPEGIDYIIPGNDDGMRAIRYYTDKVAEVILAQQEENKPIVSAAKTDEELKKEKISHISKPTVIKSTKKIDIPASQVKELREKTSAAMMDCKKALIETEGDFDAAVEWLEKNALASAAKKSDRVAAEGVIVSAASSDGKEVVLLEVNSQTDFVARNEDFVQFVDKLAHQALTLKAKDVSTLLAAPFEQSDDVSIEQSTQKLISKLGENIIIRRLAYLKTSQVMSTYIHNKRIGVVVVLEEGDEEVAKNIAMHIAASQPLYLSESDVPTQLLEDKKQELQQEIKKSETDEEIIQKHLEAKTEDYLNEICLLRQHYMLDTTQTIQQVLMAGHAKIKQFLRFELGEGIEKLTTDFASEVMAQVRG